MKTNYSRELMLEDVLSPFIESAKIAYLTFDQRAAEFDAKKPLMGSQSERQDEWNRVLAEGHPSVAALKFALRDAGVGDFSVTEIRAVVIKALLRDDPEDTREFRSLTPWQQMTRIVAGWIESAAYAAYGMPWWKAAEEVQS